MAEPAIQIIRIGFSGFSGFSGAGGSGGGSGYSGFCGKSGYSGFCGRSGYSGSGVSGYSGFSGVGTSGTSGYSGYSGYRGTSGYSGFSGYSGDNPGTSGYSGYSGDNPGTSGYSGFSGSGSGVVPYSGNYYPGGSYARVDLNGDDATGVLGDFSHPFLTVAAAIAALEGLSTSGVLDLENAYFSETITTSLRQLIVLGSKGSGFDAITFSEPTFGVYLQLSVCEINSVTLNTSNQCEIDPIGASYLGDVTATNIVSNPLIIGAGGFSNGACGNITTGGGSVVLNGLSYVGTVDAAGGDITLFSCMSFSNDYSTWGGVPDINSAASNVIVNFGLVKITACTDLTLNDGRAVTGTGGASGTITTNNVFLA